MASIAEKFELFNRSLKIAQAHFMYKTTKDVTDTAAKLDLAIRRKIANGFSNPETIAAEVVEEINSLR